MKRALAALLGLLLPLAGCTTAVQPDGTPSETTSSVTEASPNSLAFDDAMPTFQNLGDPELLAYIEDSVYAEASGAFSSDDYVVESVVATYVSSEYVQELAYNSQENVYFGYSLSDIDAQFEGTKYIFTLGDNGETVVQAFEAYDDTFNQTLKNVAIGAGVILICATVSVAAGAVGATAISTIFAASAITGTKFALGSAAIGGLVSGTVAAFESRDAGTALKSTALGASDGFKWGALTGVVGGGISKSLALRKTGVTERPPHKQSERDALKKYGGSEQKSYLGGGEVPWGTAGSSRPDIVRKAGKNYEAIEVKNYDWRNNFSAMKAELKRQIDQRSKDLPPGTRQRVVADIRGQGLSQAKIAEGKALLEAELRKIDPKIVIDVMS